MPVFRYQAYDSDGAAVEGEVEAAGKDDALAALQAQQLWVKKIQVRDSGELSKSIFSNSRVTLSELRFLTAELAMLLKNGVRIDRGLAILLRNADSVAKKRLLGSLVSSVRGGQSLSSAISEFPETFSPLYINLVKIGEQTGSLAPVFDRLSNDLNFQAALRAKITEALTYPLVILTVCIISIAFVFNYIVPQMGGLFEGLSELPFYTELLLSTSEWFRRYQLWLAGGFVFTAFAAVSALSQPESKQALIDALAKVPGLSSWFIRIERIRFNAAVAMMCAAGIAIDKAVLLACESVSAGHLRQGLLAAQQKVRKGESLSKALKSSPLFPDFSIALIEVGEESGDLVPVFEELASRARAEFESWVLRFTGLLEPVLIIFMGGIVGAVVVTMLLSIVSVNDIGI